MWPTNKEPLGELGVLVENENGEQEFVPINRCITAAGSERQKDKKKLLVIELDDIDSVPTVYYKGKKVVDKSLIKFNWLTCNAEQPGRLEFDIRHWNSISHKRGDVC